MPHARGGAEKLKQNRAGGPGARPRGVKRFARFTSLTVTVKARFTSLTVTVKARFPLLDCDSQVKENGHKQGPFSFT